MTLDEIRATLHAAAELRMPALRGLEPGERVSRLEDYLVETAVMVGRLEHARLFMHQALHEVSVKWDDIKGWEAHLGYSSRTTQDDIRRAKKEIRPDLYGSLIEGKFLVARLTEQIDRLGGLGDEKVASRLYTLITGG